MGIMEIILIIGAIIIIAISFFIREKGEEQKEPAQISTDLKTMTQDMIKEEVQNQLAMMSDDVIEDAEAKLDKITNQKIMAVGNYSEDVLKNIEDNHNEVMFLYNMLNDKETTLKNTVRDIEAVKVSVKKMAEDERVKEQEREEIAETKETQQDNQAAGIKAKKKTDLQQDDEINKQKEDKKEQILRLYREGKTNIEIAQELNLGVGEVNLILGLFV